MAAWRDSMRPARFRKAVFYVLTSRRTGGRRGVTHEYPFRDEPFREDTGRKSRGFPVEGYVAGDDYMVARDALLEALEDEGPGELVHPYHGTRRVAVLDFDLTESADSGGWARFSIDFQETPVQPVQPTASPDALGKLRSSVAAAKAAVGAEFLNKYSPGQLMDSVAEGLRKATLEINKSLSRIEMEKQRFASLKAQVDDFESSIDALVNSPADLLADIGGIFDAFEAGATKGLLSIYGFDPGVRPPATTTNRVIEQTNFDASHRLTQRLALIQAASLGPSETYSSYDDALAKRARITELLDEQAELVADDTYPTMLQLRADLTKAVPGADASLARLVKYTPRTTIPSVVLAYQLYGNQELESDLVERNAVGNPMFVPGGHELEVLSSG